MVTFEGLGENFKFIVLEVENQARSTQKFMDAPSRKRYAKITSRDDYIDNLKTIIENKCYSRIHSDQSLDQRQVNKIRAIQVICVNLEKIADYFVNIVKQMQYLDDQSFVQRYGYGEVFEVILDRLGAVLDAFHREDMSRALYICKAEPMLDDIYKVRFDRVMNEMGMGRDAQSLVTVLFIFRYFERVGDALLNIGEAVIFSLLGERIKIEQFDALQQTLSKSGFGDSFSDIDFSAIWGTRSGCRIGKVEQRENGLTTEEKRQGSIYKEGSLEKIRKERESILRWKRIFPNLVADIYGFHEDQDKGAMLVEFLNGCTLDEVILSGDGELVRNALFIFESTVLETWTTTMVELPLKTDYIRQIQSRLDGVLQTHPEFWRAPKRLGGAEVLSTDALLTACAEIEGELEAPFSVFIHGDFNINNVVYNHEAQQIHYIDLYRSRDFDYVQDASVFLVSNFRMPLFDGEHRGRINSVISQFYGFVKGFAAKHDDHTLQARLAFALARSFYTSTRFELNHKFAKEMYNRSMFLLERISQYRGGDWEQFSLPEDILYY
ncbi:MAG: phosphate uptake regulator PhoU [Pseudodesulfovibrio sp.]|jgi:phosphate uptake regulator|uniref:PhoU family transcriptional regulator n=1 Tax=Pseudodesulfovibrio indicus TaxID=1716143 RepID=A0A126QRN9_9BACT|nr:PhoU domain-containing protein [Pseudodesulfovibrio indicus]AMK12733.1 PhoU family transcriptional regulator [Pseudodesulfovibrio indicus]TDT86785.1 phosphate uptake regulator [Pseudodesulfovibrio indicus]